MSAEDYEEGRLYRENMAEEMARAFCETTNRNASKYALPPMMSWDGLDENVRESMKAAFLDMVDNKIIAPFAVVTHQKREIDQIKMLWHSLNQVLEVK